MYRASGMGANGESSPGQLRIGIHFSMAVFESNIDRRQKSCHILRLAGVGNISENQTACREGHQLPL